MVNHREHSPDYEPHKLFRHLHLHDVHMKLVSGQYDLLGDLFMILQNSLIKASLSTDWFHKMSTTKNIPSVYDFNKPRQFLAGRVNRVR